MAVDATLPVEADAQPADIIPEDADLEGAGELALQEPEEESHPAKLMRWIKTVNIAEEIDDDVLGKIGAKVIEEFEIDDATRADWMEQNKNALELAMQMAEEKTSPWPKACYSLDTDILTESGWKPVGEVSVGEKVLSRGIDGSADYYPVTKTFRHAATHMVHFEGKSIDLMVTPNHRMLVETEYQQYRDGKRHTPLRNYRRRDGTAFIGDTSFVEAGEFLKRRLSSHYIPLTSSWSGESPDKIYGIDAKAYVRLLGWYISGGWAYKPQSNRHQLADGDIRDYGPTTSSFGIAQGKEANPEKYAQIARDIEACGFTYSKRDSGYIVHARSMPDMLKNELRGMGTSGQKYIPAHVLRLAPSLLTELLDTLVSGDGCVRVRAGRSEHRSYYTISKELSGQIQELCQKLGARATIAQCEAQAGGVINGRPITGSQTGYAISINTKPRIQVAKMRRHLVPYGKDVACVEVAPHHTVYVRRNGKALWCGNSNVIFPLITVAAVQFQARAGGAIIPGRNVVKGVVIGKDQGVPNTDPQTGQVMPMLDQQSGELVPGPDGQPQIDWKIEPGEKRRRSDLIASHMSYQLLVEMEEWEEDTDRLLIMLPIAGCVFRKTYFDSTLDTNVSEIATAQNVVIQYYAKSMRRAPRVSERVTFYPSEIEEKMRGGVWTRHEFGRAVASGDDNENTEVVQGDIDAPHEFIEQHRRWDLDEDGYAEPYIVTVHRHTRKVVRIVARYDAEGVKFRGEEIIAVKPVEYYTKFDFLPNPDGGIYGMGYGKLLCPLNDSVNTIINQLIDAGTLANSSTGFLGRGLSIHGGSVKFTKGEYKAVNAPGSRIRDAIVPLEFKEPSQVLFMLLGLLIEAAKDVSSIKDVMTGEASAGTMAPTTLLGLIDQGLTVFTGIYKRVHRSLGKEMSKLYRLNRIYLEEESGYRDGDEWQEITRQDYAVGGGVVPVSDPSMVSNMQKLARAELLNSYKDDPFVNQMEIRRRTLDAAEIPDIDDVLQEPQPQEPGELEQLQSMALKTQSIKIQADIETEVAQAGSERVKQVKDLAQATLYLAQADKANGDQSIAWTAQQLDIIRVRMEGLNGRDAGGQAGQGEPPAAEEQPPMPGARKAPDGMYYVEDPDRPGRYMMVS